MSSSSRKSVTGFRALALCLGLGLMLSACQVRPLYSTTTTSGQSLETELSMVSIAPARNRVEQEIRNNLIFAFNGGGKPASPLYRLDMDVSNGAGDLSIESGSGLAKTTRVRLSVKFRLIRLEDKSVATTGSSFFTASFAKSNQRFANDRALIDAENRAAQQVSNDIHLRLAAFFTAGT